MSPFVLLGSVILLLYFVLYIWLQKTAARANIQSDADTFSLSDAELIRRLENKIDKLQKELDIYQFNSSFKNCFPGQSTSKVPKCEQIEVTFVCAGYSSSRVLVTLVKSILFYRKHPLHFHLVVDTVAHRILQTLFNTWNIPQLKISLYLLNSVVSDVSWVPNKHYSGIYGLMKLMLPKILPTALKKVIVLDTDLMFVTDIADLWALFKNMNNNQCLGLVENQSEWYLGTLWTDNKKPWPAVGRGFNTGVILMDLETMRKMNWQVLWRNVALDNLQIYGKVTLADQDVFNAVIKQNPRIVKNLPCEWNVQLGDRSLSDVCYLDIAQIKVRGTLTQILTLSTGKSGSQDICKT